jgi:hypothetical protein
MGKNPNTSGTGLSDADIQAINAATGQTQQFLHNRYAQLGIGVPSGDPAQAAASGTSLAYAGPGTAEQTDILGAAQQGQAALGGQQIANAGNPAIPGSFANLQSLANQAGYGQGVQSITGSANTGTQSGIA